MAEWVGVREKPDERMARPRELGKSGPSSSWQTGAIHSIIRFHLLNFNQFTGQSPCAKVSGLTPRNKTGLSSEPGDKSCFVLLGWD